MADFFSPPMQSNEEDEAVQFFVRLCGDVFLEIIGRGNRQQIVKLERVGRHIHWMVENFLGERPFVRLDLKIFSRPRDLRFFIFSTKYISIKIKR